MQHSFYTLLLASLLCLGACQDAPKSIITINSKGEMTVFGQSASDTETLKSILVDSLAKMTTMPDKIGIHFKGEIGMGTRQELETIATEAIEAAKMLQKAPKIEQQVFRKDQGSDCDKDDEAARTDCARIDLLYPVVVKGEKALQDSVAAWTLAYLSAILTTGAEENVKATSLEESAKVFFKTHDGFKGSVMGGGFEARTGSEVVFNNGKYLTLAINGYTYQGGAHGSPTEALNTFDGRTGKRLTWDELVTDKAAVKVLAEKKVREEKASVFADGFNFDDTFKFDLPANYGLTQEGLFLYYVPYEIMPYAMGTTELLITIDELGDLSKIRL
jgi:Deacetylase PdaC/Protein of unknown function (DUF3298)